MAVSNALSKPLDSRKLSIFRRLWTLRNQKMSNHFQVCVCHPHSLAIPLFTYYTTSNGTTVPFEGIFCKTKAVSSKSCTGALTFITNYGFLVLLTYSCSPHLFSLLLLTFSLSSLVLTPSPHSFSSPHHYNFSDGAMRNGDKTSGLFTHNPHFLVF